MQKIILTGLAIATMIVSPALAAPPTWTWTGFYLGGNVGHSWGRDSGPMTLGDVFGVDEKPHLDGFIGGGQIGFNWQANNWVFGLEADYQGTGQKGSATATCPGGSVTSVNSLCTRGHVGDTINDPALPVNVSLSEKLESLGTLRGRVGFAVMPMLLPYVTGGLAYGQVRVTETVSGTDVFGTPGANGATFTPVDESFGTKTTKTGWALGGGVEGVLLGNWTGKIEYIHVDLGTVSGSFTTSLTTPAGNSLVAGFSSHVTDNIVRVGLNYTFH